MQRSRAAILPFPGDPYLLHYWLGLYARFWSEEIDHLYIYLNSPIESAMVEYIKQTIDYLNPSGKIIFIYDPVQMEHGAVINKALDLVLEDYIMLIEDDGFIFKPGIVDWCFEKLESGQYDIVGSKRGSCAMEILTRAQQLWGLSYEGEGDHGPNFWPCYFFTRKETLLRTDRNFGARAWKRGETIASLDNYTVQGDVIAGDTFVDASLQLRAMIPKERILCIPQYHGHPDDLDHFATHYKYSMFGGEASWCHIGSLSSGVGGLLRDEVDRPLTRRLIDPPGNPTRLPKQGFESDFEKREGERRAQWWVTFWNHAESTPETNEFYELYGHATDRIIQQFNFSRENIRRRIEAYATLGL